MSHIRFVFITSINPIHFGANIVNTFICQKNYFLSLFLFLGKHVKAIFVPYSRLRCKSDPRIRQTVINYQGPLTREACVLTNGWKRMLISRLLDGFNLVSRRKFDSHGRTRSPCSYMMHIAAMTCKVSCD